MLKVIPYRISINRSHLMTKLVSFISFLFEDFSISSIFNIFRNENKINPQYNIAIAMNIMQPKIQMVKALNPVPDALICLQIRKDYLLFVCIITCINSITWALVKIFVKTRKMVTIKPALPGTTSGSMRKLIAATSTNVAHIRWQLIKIPLIPFKLRSNLIRIPNLDVSFECLIISKG